MPARQFLSSPAAVAMALLVVAACGPATPPPSGTASAGSSTASAPSGAPGTDSIPPPKGAVGLDAPDNDPALVATARAALLCFREAECEARGKWYEPFHLGRQVDVKTLVNFLEDSHPEVRAMGAGVLRGKKGQPGFNTDKGLSTRVLDALERETDEQVAREIALCAGYIEGKATGLGERLLKVLRSDPRERVRAELVATILEGNRDNPTFVEAVKELIHDPSSYVRRGALRGIDVGELREQACSFWLANLGHEDAATAEGCLSMLAMKPCPSSYPAMLDALEKKPPLFPENLLALCGVDGKLDATTKRLTDLADKWARDKSLNGSTRGQALDLLARCDRPRAKKTAQALHGDSDEYVERKVLDIEKGAKP